MRCAALLLLIISAFAEEPSGQDVLAKVRVYSQSYGERLQDFTCIKVTARSVETSGTGERFKDLDTQEQELTYVARKESYRLLKVTGTRAPNSPTIKGEFEGLPHIFDPRARTEFTFDHAEGPVCVVRYHATLESGVALHFNKGGKQESLAHHGLIYAQCASGTVTRLQMRTDEIKGKQDGLSTDIQYGPVKIGDKEFMLPLTADDAARNGKTITRAQVKFTKYKKYGAESAIHFDGDN